MTKLDLSAKGNQGPLYLLIAGFNVNVACNVFRHSAATHMLSNGANLWQKQENLGNAGLSNTQVYRTFCRVN